MGKFSFLDPKVKCLPTASIHLISNLAATFRNRGVPCLDSTVKSTNVKSPTRWGHPRHKTHNLSQTTAFFNAVRTACTVICCSHSESHQIHSIHTLIKDHPHLAAVEWDPVEPMDAVSIHPVQASINAWSMPGNPCPTPFSNSRMTSSETNGCWGNPSNPFYSRFNGSSRIYPYYWRQGWTKAEWKSI